MKLLLETAKIVVSQCSRVQSSQVQSSHMFNPWWYVTKAMAALTCPGKDDFLNQMKSLSGSGHPLFLCWCQLLATTGKGVEWC